MVRARRSGRGGCGHDGARAVSDGGERPARRFSWGAAARLILALALLAWVASTLPWEDSITWEGNEGGRATGELVGDWRAERVGFRPAAELSGRADLSAALREAARNGEVIDLARGDSGFSWRPGMPRVFMTGRPAPLAAALLLLAAGFGAGVTRWWRILLLARCPCSWSGALRLTGLGMFFNLIMPGLTGGDLVKAVLVVREHPERRADALATVVLDRLVGLWALVALATLSVWLGGAGFAPLRLPVLAALGAATAGVSVILSRRLRRGLRLDALVERVPGRARLQRLEEGARVFAGRPGALAVAVGLSGANHLAIGGAVLAIVRAFGADLGIVQAVGISSIANAGSAIPISPSGWGVGEALYRSLFELIGAEGSVGVATSVTYRLCLLVLGLAGGIFLLLPGGGRLRAEARRAARDLDA
ncbi:MAG: lysylphosphatidylglycerol synthase transmembrane domain-containing protein [Planctomycetota bacterium]|nr:lysylphosphatidylglycerol synthase transmembrane domain-containing protein [Planctomycetota bacterium]MDP6989744.1 lysylphosphatidylglycerol synthase transmembrane domain-containing protein [Planctomycetota bacterium]